MEAGPGYSVPATPIILGKWKLVEPLNGADLEVPWSCPRHKGNPMLSEATRMSAAQNWSWAQLIGPQAHKIPGAQARWYLLPSIPRPCRDIFGCQGRKDISSLSSC